MFSLGVAKLYTAVMLVLLGFVLASLRFSAPLEESREFQRASSGVYRSVALPLRGLSDRDLEQELGLLEHFVLQHDLRIKLALPLTLEDGSQELLERIESIVQNQSFPAGTVFFEFNADLTRSFLNAGSLEISLVPDEVARYLELS